MLLTETLYEVGASIVSDLQMRRIKLRDVNEFAQRSHSSKWQSRDSEVDCMTLESMLLTTMLC